MIDQFFDEASLQKAYAKYMNSNGFWDFEMVDEQKQPCSEWLDNPYVLKNDLKEALANLNELNYQRYVHGKVDITYSQYVDMIYDHCVRVFEKATRQVIHPTNFVLQNYIFSHDPASVVGDEFSRVVFFKDYRISYDLISKTHAKNVYRIVREKRISTKGLPRHTSNTERPDFAIYINGLPMVVIEMKSPGGISNAFSDYMRKVSYSFFQFCVGLDGESAFVTSSVKRQPRLWRLYGSQKDKYENDCIALVDELLCNPKQLLFYLRNCIIQTHDFGKGELLALSIQQYNVLKQCNLRLEALEVCRDNGDSRELREAVKQAARTGKSITMRSIAELIGRDYSHLFRSIIINVPDLNLKEQLGGVFGGIYVPNLGRATVIKTKQEYIDVIANGSVGIFVMNMQKYSEAVVSHYSDRNDVLFILDEVHIQQKGKGAARRSMNFPNASYIGFTASPRILQNGESVINQTMLEYGNSLAEYMDEYNNADALAANITVPVEYQQVVWSSNLDEVRIDPMDAVVYANWRAKILECEEGFEDIREQIELTFSEQIEKGIDADFETIVNSYISDHISSMNQAAQEKLRLEAIQNRMDVVLNDFKEKRIHYANTGLDNPKAFWVVNNKREALDIMAHVQRTFSSYKVDDVRFGCDISYDYSDIDHVNEKFAEFQQDLFYEVDELGQVIKTDYTIDTIQKLNMIDYGQDPIKVFDKTDGDKIDVLIVVGKHLKGYDNPNLCVVYCDTSIDEISKIYQLITRPATFAPGKRIGYFVDMTLTDKNKQTYKLSLDHYEQNNVTQTEQYSYLDANAIAQLNDKMTELFSYLARFLGITEDEFIDTSLVKEAIILSLGTQFDDNISDLYKDNQDRFYSILKQIKKIQKQLAVSRNYRSHEIKIKNLSAALAELYSLVNTERARVRVSKDNLTDVLNEMSVLLGYDGGISEMLDVKFEQIESVDVDSVEVKDHKRRNAITDKLGKLQLRVGSQPNSLRDRIVAIVSQIERRVDLDEKEKLLAEIDELLEAEKGRQATLTHGLMNKFSASVYMWLVYQSDNSDIDLDNDCVLRIFSDNLGLSLERYFSDHCLDTWDRSSTLDFLVEQCEVAVRSTWEFLNSDMKDELVAFKSGYIFKNIRKKVFKSDDNMLRVLKVLLDDLQNLR